MHNNDAKSTPKFTPIPLGQNYVLNCMLKHLFDVLTSDQYYKYNRQHNKHIYEIIVSKIYKMNKKEISSVLEPLVNKWQQEKGRLFGYHLTYDRKSQHASQRITSHILMQAGLSPKILLSSSTGKRALEEELLRAFKLKGVVRRYLESKCTNMAPIKSLYLNISPESYRRFLLLLPKTVLQCANQVLKMERKRKAQNNYTHDLWMAMSQLCIVLINKANTPNSPQTALELLQIMQESTRHKDGVVPIHLRGVIFNAMTSCSAIKAYLTRSYNISRRTMLFCSLNPEKFINKKSAIPLGNNNEDNKIFIDLYIFFAIVNRGLHRSILPKIILFMPFILREKGVGNVSNKRSLEGSKQMPAPKSLRSSVSVPSSTV